MNNLPAQIHSKFPLFIEVDPNGFGEIFANFNDEEQVAVFRSMLEHMKPHAVQWDYIAIELEKPENADVLSQLRNVLFAEEMAA